MLDKTKNEFQNFLFDKQYEFEGFFKTIDLKNVDINEVDSVTVTINYFETFAKYIITLNNGEVIESYDNCFDNVGNFIYQLFK